PEARWVLQLKFFIFLGCFALILLFVKNKTVWRWAAYLAFYPIITLGWRFPLLLVRQQRWILIFSILGFVASFVNSFRKNVVLSALVLISALLIATVNIPIVLGVCAIILFAALIYIYFRTIYSALKSSDFSKVNLAQVRRDLVAKYRLDEEIRTLPRSSLNDEQKKLWAKKVEVPVLLNRAYLYAAKKFREYQRSPAPFALATISFLCLFLLTLLVFSFVNLSIYKIDQTAFDVPSPPFFFTFVWYSFNAFVNNFVREIVPIAPLSWAAWMTNCVFSFLLLSVIISLYFSVSSKRKTQELDYAIKLFEAEGRELEVFIRSEYSVASVEEAQAELEKIEASLFKLLLWIA